MVPKQGTPYGISRGPSRWELCMRLADGTSAEPATTRFSIREPDDATAPWVSISITGLERKDDDYWKFVGFHEGVVVSGTYDSHNRCGRMFFGELHKVIVVTRRTDDFHACFKGEQSYWEIGSTAAEALGKLLLHRPSLSGITVSWSDDPLTQKHLRGEQ